MVHNSKGKKKMLFIINNSKGQFPNWVMVSLLLIKDFRKIKINENNREYLKNIKF